MAKSCFTTLIQASNTVNHSNTYIITSYIQIIFYTLFCNILFSHTIFIELTDTDNYLPPDDPNITNLMVSHYDCEKQHNLRQFNSINVKPCTEALQTFNMLKFEPEFMFELKLNPLKLSNVKLLQRKKEKSVFKAQLNTDVLIEPYGTTTPYLILLLLIH